MEESLASFEIIHQMAEIGNPNSVTDAGVGALCARAAVHGAFLNVQINTGSLEDKKYVNKVLREGKRMIKKADQLEKKIMTLVNKKMG